MNHHIYSAEDILATLIFAEQFIDVNTQGIFRETANKPQFMALLKKIQEVKDLALPFAQQVTVLDTWLQLTQQESPMPKQLAITDIHWANLIKIMLQNGSIINKDSLKVNAAWRIWLKTLQQNYQIYLNLAQYSTHDILTTQQAIKKTLKIF